MFPIASFEQEDILHPVKIFISSLGDYVPSIKSDKKGNLFKSVRKLLLSASWVRLYGLLTHFCYWNIIHPAVRSTIKDIVYAANHHLLHHVNSDTSAHENSRRGDRMHTSGSGFSTSLSMKSSLGNRSSVSNPAPQLTTAEVSTIFEVDFDGNDAFQEDKVLQERVNLPNILTQSKKVKDWQLQVVSDFITESMQKNNQLVRSMGAKQHNSDSHGKLSVEDYFDAFVANEEANEIENEIENETSPKTENEYEGTEKEFADRLQEARSERSIQFADVIVDTEMNGLGKMIYHVSDQNDQPRYLKSIDGGESLASETSLSNSEKEQLFLQLEYCLVKTFQTLGNKKMFLVSGRQVVSTNSSIVPLIIIIFIRKALVSCCHFVIDYILTSFYPWFASLPSDIEGTHIQINLINSIMILFLNEAAPKESPVFGNKTLDESTLASVHQINIRLRRLVHLGLTDFIDPTRLYTSPVLLRYWN